MARVLLFGPLRDLAGWREERGLPADPMAAYLDAMDRVVAPAIRLTRLGR